MKSIIIKGVILFHNEGTFFIEAKGIDGFVYLLKVFLKVLMLSQFLTLRGITFHI